MTAPVELQTDEAINWDLDGPTAPDTPPATNVLSIHEALALWRDTVQREQSIPRLKTGIPRIDRAMRGLQPGELFVVLARTGSGKTMFGSSLVEQVLVQRPGSAVLTVNLEMPCPQLVARTLRNYFRLTEDALEREVLADQLDVVGFCKRFAHLHFLDRGAVTLGQIRQSFADLQRQISPTPIDVVLIDHAGLVRAGRSASAYEAATATAIDAKQLARQLGVVVILVVQANRNSKPENDDPVPLEGARDSGAYEENADFVLTLGQIMTPSQGRPYVKARLAKNRRGPTVPVTLSFDPVSLRLAETEEHRG